MKRKYSIEYADNGIIIRDLDNPDLVQVAEYDQENTLVYQCPKVCEMVGSLIMQDCEAVTEDSEGLIVPLGAGFTVEYKAFGRKRE